MANRQNAGFNMLLIGKPGCGKGTQVPLITNRLVPSLLSGVGHFATGDMLRQAIKNKTAMGEVAASYIAKGELVPDAIVLEVVAEYAKNNPQHALRLWDGFPRNLPQVDIFLAFLKAQCWGAVDAVIEVDVPDGILIPRISGRRICNDCGRSFHIFASPSTNGKFCDNGICRGILYQRDDDKEELVANRLAVYREQTFPVLADILAKTSTPHICVNGDQPFERVTDQILVAILPILNKN